MEVYEKINYICEEKNIKKAEFVKRLISLEPRLRTNGLTPSEQSIYRYLNGTRELKVELLPYIAEVLEVGINELFEFDVEFASEYNIRHSKQIKEILNLLQYIPKIALEKLILKLKEYKNLHEKLNF